MDPETLRIEEIDHLIRSKKEHYTRVNSSWVRISRTRRELDLEIKNLIEERDTLAQGQLILPLTG